MYPRNSSFFGKPLEIYDKMCYNISHVGAGIPVGIYVLLAHEYQEMLETNPTNLPALFLRPAGSDSIQFIFTLCLL